MRIRSTKPEFWRSERIASVSWDARLVLKGLESYVDDNGVGKNDIALIVADVFPRDLSRNPPGTLQQVSEAISDLSDAGLLWRYEDSGTKLIYIAFWESVQRIEKPTKGRFPRPDGTMNYRDSIILAPLPEDSGNVPGTLRPGTGEQGNRGTGEQGLSSSDADAPTEDEPRPEVEKLCTHLADWVVRNGSKPPTVGKKWYDAARLLLDADGREFDKAMALIDWCQRDEFWRGNVQSMPKFRAQYDQLRLKATAQWQGGRSARPNADDTIRDLLAPVANGAQVLRLPRGERP